MMKKEKYICILYVIIAALLWGSNGVFVNLLSSSGFNSFERTSARMIIAALVETVIFCFRKEKEKVKSRDLILFALAGIIGIYGFVATYTLCISRVGMGTAAVLIYLMPTIVMIYSCIFSGERFTLIKTAALLINLAGCGLVSGILSDARPDLFGIVIGILSAFCYALNNIAVSRLSSYSPFTRMYYPSLFAALCGILYLIVFSDPHGIAAHLFSKPSDLLACFLWAVCCSMCTYYLFNKALKHISVTEASILSSFELVFAVVFGVVFFRESFDTANFIGAILVVLSIIIMEKR